VISHKWKTPDHPDPDGETNKLILTELTKFEDVKYVFVDFICLPQYPRNENDDVIFKESLKNMSKFYHSLDVIIIISDGYYKSAWCQFERFCSLTMITLIDIEEGPIKDVFISKKSIIYRILYWFILIVYCVMHFILLLLCMLYIKDNVKKWNKMIGNLKHIIWPFIQENKLKWIENVMATNGSDVGLIYNLMI
jgi:hypothetical protein